MAKILQLKKKKRIKNYTIILWKNNANPHKFITGGKTKLTLISFFFFELYNFITLIVQYNSKLTNVLGTWLHKLQLNTVYIR